MRKILIVDSSSVIAMRLKVLLELIQCDVDLVHYSMLSEEIVYDYYDLTVSLMVFRSIQSIHSFTK